MLSSATRAVLLAGPLLLAGCFAAAPEDGVTASGASADDATPADGPATTSPGADPSATPAPSTSIPVELQGATRNEAAICAPGSCQGWGLPGLASGETWFEQELRGTLVAADLTLTWTATTPATTELTLGIAHDHGDGTKIETRGPSPLTLSQAGLAIPGEKVSAIYVNAYECSANVCHSVEQAFSISGTLAQQAS